jgi:hypothetical protein
MHRYVCVALSVRVFGGRKAECRVGLVYKLFELMNWVSLVGLALALACILKYMIDENYELMSTSCPIHYLTLAVPVPTRHLTTPLTAFSQTQVPSPLPFPRSP